MRTLALVASCGKGDPEEAPAPADPAALVGAFQVDVKAPTSTSAGSVSVFGTLYDGSTPQSVVWDQSHHGGTKGKVECVTNDDGSMQLAATLVGQLLDLGYAGFPTVVVTRRSVDSATTALGRVDLVVSSAVEEGVEIPGLDSCNDDTDCPEGKPCLLPDRICTP